MVIERLWWSHSLLRTCFERTRHNTSRQRRDDPFVKMAVLSFFTEMSAMSWIIGLCLFAKDFIYLESGNGERTTSG